MDPNLFHLDWDRLAEVLATIIVLAFILERALALLFESRGFVGSQLDLHGGKEIIAFIVAAAVCIYWKFDSISMIVLRDHATIWGDLITGGIIAGGRRASIKLFQDVLNIKSSAVRQKQAVQASATSQTIAVVAVPAPRVGEIRP